MSKRIIVKKNWILHGYGYVMECINCGKRFRIKGSRYRSGRGRFCSKECCSIYKSRIIKCSTCGKRMKIKRTHYRQYNEHFCSMECRGIGQLGKKNTRWLGGKSFEPYSINWNDALKRKIRYRDNYTCQKCERVWNKNDRKFPVHHIDYDKMNCKPENLITLCHRCHARVNANRNYWMKLFRQKIDKDIVRPT